MKDLISIIVPIYKVEKYIYTCIDSIINQSYKNIEIILVDDGSPDKCGLICDEYAKVDTRIIVIHKENGGLSDARNAGIAIARGEYFSFIDSDDWIDVTYIEVLHNIIYTYSVDIAMCKFKRVYNDSNINCKKESNIFRYSNIEALYESYKNNRAHFVVAHCKLYRTSLFNDIIFPVGRIHEDEFVTYKLLHLSEDIAFTQQELYYYRQRNDSIIGKGFDVKATLDTIDGFYESIDYYISVGLNELSNNVYKQILLIYVSSIHKNRKNLVIEIGTEKYYSNLIKFRNEFKKSNQSIFINIFGYAFFATPNIISGAFNIYRLIISKIKKIL